MSQLVAVVFVSQSWSRGAKWSRNSRTVLFFSSFFGFVLFVFLLDELLRLELCFLSGCRGGRKRGLGVDPGSLSGFLMVCSVAALVYSHWSLHMVVNDVRVVVCTALVRSVC